VLLDLLEHLATVLGLTTELDIALPFDQASDAFANDAVVVGDENGNHPSRIHGIDPPDQ
jgi:hypothetical protein